jgi:hypothetical protein
MSTVRCTCPLAVGVGTLRLWISSKRLNFTDNSPKARTGCWPHQQISNSFLWICRPFFRLVASPARGADKRPGRPLCSSLRTSANLGAARTLTGAALVIESHGAAKKTAAPRQGRRRRRRPVGSQLPSRCVSGRCAASKAPKTSPPQHHQCQAVAIATARCCALRECTTPRGKRRFETYPSARVRRPRWTEGPTCVKQTRECGDVPYNRGREKKPIGG